MIKITELYDFEKWIEERLGALLSCEFITKSVLYYLGETMLMHLSKSNTINSAVELTHVKLITYNLPIEIAIMSVDLMVKDFNLVSGSFDYTYYDNKTLVSITHYENLHSTFQ